jgi:transposase-like protein
LSRGAAFRSFLRCEIPSVISTVHPEVIRLAVMMYIRYPLSLRQVEDLLFERGMALSD